MKNIADIAAEIHLRGFCFVPAKVASAFSATALPDWPRFATSWADMPLDTYMADGGRYRRRRFSTFEIGPNVFRAKPTEPHYQGREYNALNGGIARHYEAISTDVRDGTTLTALLTHCYAIFDALMPHTTWHVEVHQFRIEARRDAHGQPTPEGVHRDGVDFVMVMMVRRDNIAEGTTTIHHPDGTTQASFTLTEPGDMTYLNDHRCLHGVTPVTPLDSSRAAYRDVLVVTFRRQSLATN